MKSIWEDKSDLPQFPMLKDDIKTDVLIIGGGIAGILTAYFLKNQGISYTLVEKNKICTKTTMNTSAKITLQHSLIYHKILKSMGLQNAKMYLEANKAAFEKYAQLCKSIDCDYEIKDNYVYSVDDRSRLEKELEALDKIGYQAEFLSNINLPIETQGAVRFLNQAQFNPIKFLSSIAQGLNIYEDTFVCEMIGNTAVTPYGKIDADKVIVTTHFPFINKHGSYFLKLYQHRSYMLALENAIDVDGMYVDESKKGFSFRNYGEYLLLGGGAHRTGKKGGNWNELRQFANEKFPDAKAQFYWAAQDCMSLDSVPYIGRYSKRTTDLYVASGFHKWGMTSAMAAAMMLSDMVAGQSVEYGDVFNPSRSIMKPQLLINGFEATKNLLTFTKKRCPHLGCALKWNAAEQSWDCPCHGSRFTKEGAVIENPANGDLKKK